MKPTYNLTDFTNDCAIGEIKAYVSKGAMDTAKSDFNLNTQKHVLGFIGNGGLEKMELINTKQWENNPSPNDPIMVDAYNFYSGSIYGYIAFFYQIKTAKWVIKSFKKNSELDVRNFAFREILQKLKI